MPTNPVYTTQIAAAVLPAGLAQTLFTTPNEGVWVVRDLLLTFDGAGTNGVSLFVQDGPRSFYLYLSDDLTPGETRHVDLRQVLRPGARLTGVSQAGNTYVAITGYSFA